MLQALLVIAILVVANWARATSDRQKADTLNPFSRAASAMSAFIPRVTDISMAAANRWVSVWTYATFCVS